MPPERQEAFVLADDGTELYRRTRPADDPQGASQITSVLADGIACDGFIWKYLWDPLATRGPVAHFNYRGHGRSKRPVDPERIDVPDHARDLDTIRRSLGDPECVLFGHSMGCQVVLEAFRVRREHIRGLVLICGAPGRVTHTFKGSDALAQALPRLIETVDKHPQLARAVWGSVPPELALKIALAMGEVDGRLIEPRDLVRYLEHMVDMELPMFLRMLRAAGEHTTEDMLPTIDVPVLVIAGEKDTFTPPRLAEQMARAIPKGELVMTSGTHVVPLEQRALVEEKILDFVDRVRVTPA